MLLSCSRHSGFPGWGGGWTALALVDEMEQPLPLSTALAALCVGIGLGGTLIQVLIRFSPG